jgi:hypothetical protein
MIQKSGSNVKLNYCGSVQSREVDDTFSQCTWSVKQANVALSFTLKTVSHIFSGIHNKRFLERHDAFRLEKDPVSQHDP